MKYLEKEEEFNELIAFEKVLVDFYATWCAPCRMLSPILEEVEKESTIKILKVDVDKYPNLAASYGIMSIPALKLFSGGKEIKSQIGYMSKEELKEFLK